MMQPELATEAPSAAAITRPSLDLLVSASRSGVIASISFNGSFGDLRRAARRGPPAARAAPAPSDRNSLTIGPDGPILLHDVHFLEQMAHFNREKVPERQPHAKGSGAFGTFETTHDVSAYTKAALFQPGAKTEMLARFELFQKMARER